MSKHGVAGVGCFVFASLQVRVGAQEMVRSGKKSSTRGPDGSGLSLLQSYGISVYIDFSLGCMDR